MKLFLYNNKIATANNKVVGSETISDNTLYQVDNEIATADGKVATIPVVTYTLTTTFTGLTSDAPSEVSPNTTYTITLTPNITNGYVVPIEASEFTITNASIVSYTESTGVLVINNVVDNVRISASGTRPLCFKGCADPETGSENQISFRVSGTLTHNQSISYSNDGKTWAVLPFGTILQGAYVFVRSTNATNSAFSELNGTTIFCNVPVTGSCEPGTITVSGNVMSLLDRSCQLTSLEGYDGCFAHLFDTMIGASRSISWMSASSYIQLPATALSQCCYQYMFAYQSYLIAAPQLPAGTLADYCYSNMFNSCTSLQTLVRSDPEMGYLLATELAEGCYQSMFTNCTSLEAAPWILPATEACDMCYNSMFYGCVSLTGAPTIAAHDYGQCSCLQMFYECASLEQPPLIARVDSENNSFGAIFSYSGIELYDQTIEDYYVWGIPSTCGTISTGDFDLGHIYYTPYQPMIHDMHTEGYVSISYTELYNEQEDCYYLCSPILFVRVNDPYSEETFGSMIDSENYLCDTNYCQRQSDYDWLVIALEEHHEGFGGYGWQPISSEEDRLPCEVSGSDTQTLMYYAERIAYEDPTAFTWTLE